MKIRPTKLARVIVPVVKAWSLTLGYVQVNYSNYLELKKQGQKVIFGIWHGELFPLCYLHRNQKIRVLVSPSQDGELIAQVLMRMGFELARGSSSKTGVKALIDMLKKFKADPKDMVITMDGPRGPRHRAKEGILYLANKLKLPIIPVRIKLSAKFIFKKSWDQFELPYPFASCKVVYGKPFWIEGKINKTSLHDKQKQLTSIMNTLV